MKQIILIAAGEWRYWLRSYLALGSACIFLVLIIVTSIVNTVRIDAQNHLRSHQQTQAEETFLTQPDRHPHRMVHYGHYVFRAPAPLAIFDPGLDSVTGQAMFLEGHRQNTAMFAESSASADLGGLSWLSPALIYQIFAPLIIILLGHGAVVREREAGVLTPFLALGISGNKLILGKALALCSFVLLLLAPLLGTCAMALFNGESLFALLMLFVTYWLYLTVWVVLVLCASTLLHKRSSVLAVLASFWFIFTLVLPSVAVVFSIHAKPLAGKIETDLAMLKDIRTLGDGHNANDPAFQKLRADALKKYNVERVEDLPINFRGMVAMQGEQKLTKVLKQYAQNRMKSEAEQEKHIMSFGWLTPALAVTFASRSIAGTDLLHYHRFQEEAEALRFSFVQGLNRAHIEKLSYQDDINRNKDDESSMRARVDASNWQVLDAYMFRTASITERIAHASTSFIMILVWLFTFGSVLLWRGTKMSAVRGLRYE